MVSRRLANSLSTKAAKASPASQAGVQPFFSMDSAQLLLFRALSSLAIRSSRCALLMPGAP